MQNRVRSLTCIQVLLVLPDNNHVHNWVQTRHIRVVRLDRADVGVQAKRLATGHIKTLNPAPRGCGNRSLNPCGKLNNFSKAVASDKKKLYSK